MDSYTINISYIVKSIMTSHSQHGIQTFVTEDNPNEIEYNVVLPHGVNAKIGTVIYTHRSSIKYEILCDNSKLITVHVSTRIAIKGKTYKFIKHHASRDKSGKICITVVTTTSTSIQPIPKFIIDFTTYDFEIVDEIVILKNGRNRYKRYFDEQNTTESSNKIQKHNEDNAQVFDGNDVVFIEGKFVRNKNVKINEPQDVVKSALLHKISDTHYIVNYELKTNVNHNITGVLFVDSVIQVSCDFATELDGNTSFNIPLPPELANKVPSHIEQVYYELSRETACDNRIELFYE